MTSSTSSPERRTLGLAFAGLGLAAGVTATVWASIAAHAVTAATVFLGLCTIALVWVLWLVFRAVMALVKDPPPEEVAIATGRRRKELERDKQALLKALKELEFDHQMGKVSDADFRDLGANYRARAVRVMRQLDLADAGADYHKLVERDLRQRMAQKPKDDKKAEAEAATPPPDGVSRTADSDEEEGSTALREHPLSVSATREGARAKMLCPACNTANDSDADFCKKCGKPMAAA